MTTIAVLPGDGIGPEIAAPAVQVLTELLGSQVAFEEYVFGGASIDVCYEVSDLAEPSDAAAPPVAVYARARTTLVLVDAATGAPRRISGTERAAWQAYVEEPVRIRRRNDRER